MSMNTSFYLSHSHKGNYQFTGKLEQISEQNYLVFFMFFDPIRRIIMCRKCCYKL